MNTLYILGDSTAAEKNSDKRPETGWAEMFHPYLAPSWRIDNHAVNGRSTKSFISEGRFDRILEKAKSGDAAFIEFGHNDEKSDEERHTEPFGSYVENLCFMARRLRAKGVEVFFLTSIARRIFSAGRIEDTHADYPAAMKYAAHLSECSVIDLTLATMTDLMRLGDEGSRKLYMNLEAGEYPFYPEGKRDDSHLTVEGAKWVSALLFRELGRLKSRPRFLIPSQSGAIDDDYSRNETAD